jgi:hypothetical protein
MSNALIDLTRIIVCNDNIIDVNKKNKNVTLVMRKKEGRIITRCLEIDINQGGA